MDSLKATTPKTDAPSVPPNAKKGLGGDLAGKTTVPFASSASTGTGLRGTMTGKAAASTPAAPVSPAAAPASKDDIVFLDSAGKRVRVGDTVVTAASGSTAKEWTVMEIATKHDFKMDIPIIRCAQKRSDGVTPGRSNFSQTNANYYNLVVKDAHTPAAKTSLRGKGVKAPSA